MNTSNQIATFTNAEFGIASIVTNTKKGYAVTFLDTDAEEVIQTRFYPHDKQSSAIEYAKSLTA